MEHDAVQPGQVRTRKPMPQHWRALIALTVIVAIVHAWLTYEVSQQMQALSAGDPAIQRMEATYVSEVRLSKPPAAPPARPAAKAPPPQAAKASSKKPKPKPVKAASAPDEAASAAKVEDSASAPVVADAASAPASAAEIVAQAPSAPVEQAQQTAQAASEPESPAFVWPKATKVTYKLEGFFRGPIYGQASVEWVRQKQRYQVRVDASVGPSFAPLGSWSLISEGDITPDGLYPARYQNTNRLLIRSRPPQSITFEEAELTLPNGTRLPRTPDMQDPASQFIQLAYQFIMNPKLLQVGNTIEMQLVWLKKTERLAYDVVKEETLSTPLGDLPTFHVKPRRMVVDAGNSMSAEIWFAPTLQYLPVRILTRLDDQTFMDMQMDKPPQQSPGDSTGE